MVLGVQNQGKKTYRPLRRMKYPSRIDFPALLERVIYTCTLQKFFGQFFPTWRCQISVLVYSTISFTAMVMKVKVQRKQSHGTQKRKYVCVCLCSHHIARHISSKHEILQEELCFPFSSTPPPLPVPPSFAFL